MSSFSILESKKNILMWTTIVTEWYKMIFIKLKHLKTWAYCDKSMPTVLLAPISRVKLQEGWYNEQMYSSNIKGKRLQHFTFSASLHTCYLNLKKVNGIWSGLLRRRVFLFWLSIFFTCWFFIHVISRKKTCTQFAAINQFFVLNLDIWFLLLVNCQHHCYLDRSPHLILHTK